MNLKAIKQFYSEVSTNKLEELVDKINGLEPAVIPLLLAELRSRNEQELVERIEYFMVNPWDGNITEESFDKIMDEVEERKNMGEDLESIKLDLKTRIGIENYDKIIERLSINQSSISDDLYVQAASEVFRMQQLNLSNEQMQKQLDCYNVPKNISEQIIIQSTEDKDGLAKAVNDKLRRRSINDLIYGLIILAIGLAITIGSLAMDSGHFIISYGAILVGGVKTLRGLINRGNLQE